MSALSAPDAIQPIRAWRVWKAVRMPDGSVLLGSLVGRTAWPRGEAMRAHCRRSGHPAPSAGCSCGIYAHRSRDAALQHARDSGPDLIVGEVELWGHVVEHEHGFRAERARPIALMVPLTNGIGEASAATDALARCSALSTYGVRTHLVDLATGAGLDFADIGRMLAPKPRAPMVPLDTSERWLWRALALIPTAIVSLLWIGGICVVVAVLVASSHPPHHTKLTGSSESRSSTVVPKPHPTERTRPKKVSISPPSRQRLRRIELRACSLIEFNGAQARFPAYWEKCRLDFPQEFSYAVP
jgi:hypothetical protein